MAKVPRDLGALQERIGHRFTQKSLLEEAITHASGISVRKGRPKNYQRLEFLGDRVLGLCVTDLLLAAFPKAQEGELSNRLAFLVRRETCADVAEEWDVGPNLFLGGGEVMSGARLNRAILSDSCESIVAAVFLDAGYAAARAVVEGAFGKRMEASKKPPRDPKTLLQEWAQGKGLPLPVYSVVERTGPDHKPEFRLNVAVEPLEPVEGLGSNKRDAEQAAATAMLVRERVWKSDTGA